MYAQGSESVFFQALKRMLIPKVERKEGRETFNTRLSGEGAARVAAAAPANSLEGGEKVKPPSPEPPPKLTATEGGPRGTWTEPVWTQELQGL